MEDQLILSVQDQERLELSHHAFDEGKLVLFLRNKGDSYALQMNIENRSQLLEDFIKNIDAILEAKGNDETNESEHGGDSTTRTRSL